jgi:hypothetical protein
LTGPLEPWSEFIARLLSESESTTHVAEQTRPDIEPANRRKPAPYDPGPKGWYGNRVVSDDGRYVSFPSGDC